MADRALVAFRRCSDTRRCCAIRTFKAVTQPTNSWVNCERPLTHAARLSRERFAVCLLWVNHVAFSMFAIGPLFPR
jgi:hypothetical protein